MHNTVHPPTIAFNPSTDAPALPIELHDGIMEYVIADGSQITLFHCIFVSRRWYALYKAALYRVVRIHTGDQLSIFMRTVSSEQTLGSRVQELEISLGSPHATWGETIAVNRLSRYLPNVHTLRYFSPTGRIHIPSPLSRHFPLTLGRFMKLTTLSLENYRFNSYLDLLRLIGTSQLSILHFKEVNCGHIPNGQPRLHRLIYNRPKHVHVTSCDFTWAVPWLWAASLRPCDPDKPINPEQGQKMFPGISLGDTATIQDICRQSASYTDQKQKTVPTDKLRVDFDFKEEPGHSRCEVLSRSLF